MKCPFCIKICTKCKRILIANEINFNKNNKGKYKLDPKCKKCHKQYRECNKETKSIYNKQYRKNNKDKEKEYMKQYRKDNKEKISIKKKDYYKENKNDIKEKVKKYYEDNIDKRKEYMSQYYKDNECKFLNYNNKRRQIEEEQGNGITTEQWQEMMKFFNFSCAYSGIKFDSHNKDNKRTIDHIVSLNNGGEHEIWNLVPMYKNYNCKKNTSNMEDWYMEQDFFDIDRLLKIYEWIEYAYKKWHR